MICDKATAIAILPPSTNWVLAVTRSFGHLGAKPQHAFQHIQFHGAAKWVFEPSHPRSKPNHPRSNIFPGGGWTHTRRHPASSDVVQSTRNVSSAYRIVEICISWVGGRRQLPALARIPEPTPVLPHAFEQTLTSEPRGAELVPISKHVHELLPVCRHMLSVA